jgi:cell division septation protein DedD
MKRRWVCSFMKATCGFAGDYRTAALTRCDALGVADARSKNSVECPSSERILGAIVKARFSGRGAVVVACAIWLGLAGCSRQQSDWEKARGANSIDSYETFLKTYPSGEFTAQAQARVKELYEERDWQKARDADTPDSYQAFLKLYPEGKWAEEARIRVENFSLGQAPTTAPANAEAPIVAPVPLSAAAPAAAAKPAVKPATKLASKAGNKAATKAATSAAAQGAAAPGGQYAVQLGAFSSGSGAAEKAWPALQTKFPAQLKGVKHAVLVGKGGKGQLYRLQATGLGRDQARKICAGLKAKSQACVVIAPKH